MIDCPHPDCSDTEDNFETERAMKIHHKSAHGESIAKVETTCSAEDCTNEFKYYPSSKEGKFCEDCVEQSDAAHGPSKDSPDWSEINGSDKSPEDYYNDTKKRTGFDESYVGDVSEKVFEAEMTKRGIKLSKPTNYMCEYDYVADIDGQLYKIQVKTGTEKRGTIIFRTVRQTVNRNSIKRREYEDIDAFVVRNKHNDGLYWIPQGIIGDSQKMCLRVEEPIQDQSNINWAEDYELDKKLEGLRG
jgi:hypothetical protein